MSSSKSSNSSNTSYAYSTLATSFVALYLVFLFFSSVSNVPLFCLKFLSKSIKYAHISLLFDPAEILENFISQCIWKVYQLHIGRGSWKNFNHESSVPNMISSSFTIYVLLLLFISIIHP